MPFDFESAKVALGVATAALGVLGTIFGWFGKTWRWLTSHLAPKPVKGVIDVPSKTLICMPVSRPNALWWHMGSNGSEPAMQIVGDLNVTNIAKRGVYVMEAKLRRPKAVGHAIVRAQNSNLYDTKHIIPQGGISDLRFDFFVQPPVRTAGQKFTADVAIVDQFGNEHWLKDLEFRYH